MRRRVLISLVPLWLGLVAACSSATSSATGTASSTTGTTARSATTTTARSATTTTTAAPGPGPSRPRPAVTVSPGTGGPHTRFRVSFRMPTDRPAPTQIRRVSVTATGPAGRDCASAASGALPAGVRSGAPAHVGLFPAAGAAWCRGTYHGRVVVLAMPRCGGPARACPMFVAIVRTVGRFSFRVK